MTDISKIRNFCIIAHIDHGKSTLADRLIEFTNTIAKRDIKEQTLDDMSLERERGITIKAHPICLEYIDDKNQQWTLHLIDTPGHVDFSYEVSRSLQACEGVVLLVDAGQGIQAQTISNIHLALEHNLEIIPVVNKIDLPNAETENVIDQVVSLLGCKREEIIRASGKTGIGTKEILDAVVQRVPPPKGVRSDPLKALIFDSEFDSYKGVIVYVRVFEGLIQKRMMVEFMMTGQNFEILELGKFKLGLDPRESLGPGEVGYILANIRDVAAVKIGDTVTHKLKRAKEALPGFKEMKPMVFCGLYPISNDDYNGLKKSIEKLKLNDDSFTFQADDCVALGFGFRCGFLGLLHMEIIQQRLEQEYDVNIIATAPSVIYRVYLNNGEVKMINNPIHFPDRTQILRIEEPMVEAFIIFPNEYMGAILQLVNDFRGVCIKTEALIHERIVITCELPLNEILTEFYDRLKSVTRGYASMDYEHKGYKESDMVKMDVLINGENVDAFSNIIHRDKSESKARSLAKKLKELIPRQMFQIAIQAAISNKIIARETISALKKDVTAKCYGGDITRKRKLWEKQKEGKKKMKQFGKVDIPQKAFWAVLKVDN